jgi:hypothetical protein
VASCSVSSAHFLMTVRSWMLSLPRGISRRAFGRIAVLRWSLQVFSFHMVICHAPDIYSVAGLFVEVEGSARAT